MVSTSSLLIVPCSACVTIALDSMNQIDSITRLEDMCEKDLAKIVELRRPSRMRLGQTSFGGDLQILWHAGAP